MSRLFLTLLRRELKTYLRSMFGWTLIAVFSAAVSGIFLLSMARAEGSVQTVEILFSTAVAFVLPALTALATMRTFAEERQSGTLEVLLSAPVPDATVVTAKFAGAFCVVALALALSVGPLAIYREIIGVRNFTRKALAVSIGLLAAHGAAWTALGVMSSLLCRRQAVAALLSVGLTFPASLFVSNSLSDIRLPTFFQAVSVVYTAHGVFDTRPLVLALSLAFLFLFASARLLESRRWSL